MSKLMKKGFWVVVKDMIRNADVILEVLDARMPELTRNKKLEKYASILGKRLILVINKIDIVSPKTIESIEKRYSGQDYALVSSTAGKGMEHFIRLIRGKTKKDAFKVTVIGYPNTGKSSLINRLSRGGKAKTSLESGFTKGMQLITGKSGLMLIDTPGVVPYGAREEAMLGLTSAISPDKLSDPEAVAYHLLKIFKQNNPIVLEKEYGLNADLSPEELLLEFGKKRNMLIKKGMVDERRAAIQLLTDWHKGKIRL
ncbi:50S ribosome-binding GTPase [Candidatus Woesearchaeota archaeon]|nr:50S ribosome-binding GTPase [Candidatus Woesearchaeota archaeon]